MGLDLFGARSVDGPADGHSKDLREKRLQLFRQKVKVILIWAIGFLGQIRK